MLIIRGGGGFYYGPSVQMAAGPSVNTDGYSAYTTWNATNWNQDPNTILYRATIDDPSTYAKPWTVEYPFVATRGPVYEYACHEGNYAMPDILGGARKQDLDGK